MVLNRPWQIWGSSGIWTRGLSHPKRESYPLNVPHCSLNCHANKAYWRAADWDTLSSMNRNTLQYTFFVYNSSFPPDGSINSLLHRAAVGLWCSALSVCVLPVSAFDTTVLSVINLFFTAWEKGSVAWECVKGVNCVSPTVNAWELAALLMPN